MASLVWTAIWIAGIISGDFSPAFAQRRRAAEPETNPQFQSDVQGQHNAGGKPVAAPPEAPRDEDKVTEGPSAAPRAIPSVQIGAAANVSDEPRQPKNPMETRVTVRVKEAPLATFLDTISAQARVNFIITEGLEKKRITAFLQNVTVREALQILLEIKGLTYQRIGSSNTYIISPRSRQAPNRITRIYTLGFISLIPITQTTQQASQSSPFSVINTGGGGLGGGQGQGGTGSGAGSGSGSQGGPAAAADSGISFLQVIKSVLSKEGTIATDPRTNSLVVTDIAEIFPQVEQIISELDKKSPQIMIEAQIVEIDSDKTQDLGVEWGGPNGELARFTGGSRQVTFPFNLPVGLKNTHFFDGKLPDPSVTLGSQGGGAATTAGAAGTTGITGAQNGGTLTLNPAIVSMQNLNIILHALITRSQAKFLGKPKILTLNNKSANIQILRNQATGTDAGIAAGGAGPGLAISGVERQQTGLILKVTPQINKEGYITMLAEPTFTDAVASPILNNGQPVFDPVTRTASSLMRVKNGQTMVLGGLLSSQENKIEKRVPFLGYIPLIGWLFTSTSTSRHNTDLVIFLTPTIVNE